MLRVIKAKTVSDSSDVTSVDLDDIENFLPLEEVFIGHQTLKYLEDNDSLSTTDVRKFRQVCFLWWYSYKRKYPTFASNPLNSEQLELA